MTKIGVLSGTYNYMTAEINQLMDYEKKPPNCRSDFSRPQAQINPHFLYNTLDMINWLSQGTGKAKSNGSQVGLLPVSTA